MTLPITLAEAKHQLRISADDDAQDDEINGFIAQAAAWVENYTGHILEAREVIEQFAGFGRMRLKAWPIASNAVVTLAYDGPGVVTTITGARLDVSGRPAVVRPPASLAWPLVATGTLVTVAVRAGYEDPATVPGSLKRAMLLLIGAFDADREGGEVLAKAEETARGLCRFYRPRGL